jgi:hypothetical protein
MRYGTIVFEGDPMLRKPQVLGLQLLILLCVGCAVQPDSRLIPTAQYLAQNPMPLPDFVAGIDPAPGSVVLPSSEICVTLYTGAILEKGDTAGSLRNQIVTNTEFLINNQKLSPFVFVRHEYPAVLVQIIDGVGTSIITSCFTPDLAQGSHLITVNTLSSSGKLYTYSWALEIR